MIYKIVKKYAANCFDVIPTEYPTRYLSTHTYDENIETVERQQVLLVEVARGVLTAVNVSY